jgi:uncharacterized membrane protein
MSFPWVLPGFSVVVLLASVGCGEKMNPVPDPVQGPGNCSANTAVSYNGQIHALVEKYCVACHTPGGSAPATVRFDTYADAKIHADRMNARVQAGTMPIPAANNPVSSEDKCLFQAWIDQGATEN